MNCLRCGYCCHRLSVIIVSDPELGVVESNYKVHNGDGPCKHLSGDKPGGYSCSVHDEGWYPRTPCARYNQGGEGDCRMGKTVTECILKVKHPEFEWAW